MEADKKLLEKMKSKLIQRSKSKELIFCLSFAEGVDDDDGCSSQRRLSGWRVGKYSTQSTYTVGGGGGEETLAEIKTGYQPRNIYAVGKKILMTDVQYHVYIFLFPNLPCSIPLPDFFLLHATDGLASSLERILASQSQGFFFRSDTYPGITRSLILIGDAELRISVIQFNNFLLVKGWEVTGA